MAMQPAIASQNGRGYWLYKRFTAATQIFSKEVTEERSS